MDRSDNRWRRFRALRGLSQQHFEVLQMPSLSVDFSFVFQISNIVSHPLTLLIFPSFLYRQKD